MNRLLESPPTGMDARKQSVTPVSRMPRLSALTASREPEKKPARQQSRGFVYSPAPIWHNLLYGLVTAGLTVGPLFIPGIGYYGVMIGIGAVSAGIYVLLMLAGVFQDFLPLGRPTQSERDRKR